MGGCFAQNKSQKLNPKGDKLKQPSFERRDTIQEAGVVLRKKVVRAEPARVDEVLYMRPVEVLRMLGPGTKKEEHQRFVSLLETSGFTDLISIVGWDMIADKD